MNAKEYEDWLWLCSVPGLGDGQRRALLSYFRSPGAVREASDEELALWKKTGVKWIRAVENCRRDTFLPEIMEVMEREQIMFIPKGDPCYPKRLEQIVDAPMGLFVKGRKEVLRGENTPQAAVIGARICSDYGSDMACRFGEILADYHIPVISGMAMGIDGLAQRSAVQNGGISVGVLGCGVDICYPAENRNLYHELQAAGCLISEYPPGTKGYKGNFPRRNRIISGMSDVVVLVEARLKSGSLITADFALEQGRDVLAVPGRSTDALSGGCNRLIEQGAGILLSPENLIRYLEIRFPDHFAGLKKAGGENGSKKKGNSGAEVLAPELRSVYEKIDTRPVSLEKLMQKTGLSVPELTRILLRLQLADLIRECDKNRYIRL